MATKNLLVVLLPLTVYAIGRPQYECGQHGRFEYCIDGISDCVVGCHCHPGYYFDTNSKICEPNGKLVGQYRRLYGVDKPTPHIPDISVTPSYRNAKARASTSIVESHVENIAKDADDLGDWLYNQFFKTIESQIINKTDEEKKSKKIFKTRRAGSRGGKEKSSRRSKKKSGLRKKLLRIAENDSLFRSSSESDPSSSSSYESSDDDYKKKHWDDSGHREIVLFNKKPKPPLPSFIFLPNYETPFFPPMGLPPPPPMPMYPMIPVPPVMPFPLPPPHTTTTTTTTTASTTTTKSSTESTTIPVETSDVVSEEEQQPTDAPIPETKSPGRHGLRKQRLQRVRIKLPQQKMSHSKRQRKPKPPISFFKQDFDPQLMDEEVIPQDTHLQTNPYHDKDTPLIDNVDFKYLTQLIHRFDNQSNINGNINATDMILPFKRRHINNDYINQLEAPSHPDFNKRRLLTSPGESYYAKLGQEIATLIRRIDTTGDRDLNVGIDHNARVGVHPNPVFNDNSYARRSYWERYVRSPLNQSSSDGELVPQNYENLLSIESKVENLANTANPLSLQELENVVYLMDTAKSRLEYKIDNIKKKEINARNISSKLLPHLRNHDVPQAQRQEYEYYRDSVTEKIYKITKKSKKFNTFGEYNVSRLNSLRGFVLQHFKIRPNYPQQNYKNDTRTPHTRKNSRKNEDTNTPSKISFKINEVLHDKPADIKISWNPHTQHEVFKSRGLFDSRSPTKKLLKKSQPTSPKYYFYGNNGFQKETQDSIPLVNKIGKLSRPSYFQHEIHHFDYFE